MKICLSGYYGFDNAGDEALLAAITSTLRRLSAEIEFVVFSGQPERTAYLHGLRAVSRTNPFAVIKELWQADLLISGGGSLMQDVTSTRSLVYYIGIVALAKLLRKPVVFYAQGIGPLNKRFSRFLMFHIANKVDLITLRDMASLNLLKEIGVKKPPVRVTADPVFTLEPEDEDYKKAEAILQSFFPAKNPIIGVSVRKWEKLAGYQEVLARVLDDLAAEGYKIVLVPMDYRNDMEESRKIKSLMGKECYIIDQSLKSTEYMALISFFELMIGMRLHSLIFSASQGVPFAAISYDPKVEAFAESFHLKPLALDYRDMKAYIDKLLKDKEVRNRVKEKAQEMKEKALENAYLTWGVLEARQVKKRGK
ncbi:polysaccharide pyruvyl transferase CsaB [Thermosyntropha lipolytica DSM 11003]|uniref:Polysaccharide pyruvyl transferase CsaB n=1 Tax=Thermosyntropha lipolytica DSM 11003 TaxID=1123382 RepID=A0A1M5JRV3_9FIRM|nr:polysaccharide pyruvyl transferase CsaB [Thermosyntropha lipolytica]SHG42999.1 polysaccharide pyruvyl transferase CsaB [Thermosyntropha lipolytica DSM 11003]